MPPEERQFERDLKAALQESEQVCSEVGGASAQLRATGEEGEREEKQREVEVQEEEEGEEGRGGEERRGGEEKMGGQSERMEEV